jgi:ring-1,2-phenylacetyl-CoA epoxidase subunit PaaB
MNAAQAQPSPAALKEWPLWEVFVRSKQGLEHKHCGSLHAADAGQALVMARDVYTRRQEGVSIWVVPSKAITASSPDDKGRRPTRFTDIRPSTASPTKWGTCDDGDP